MQTGGGPSGYPAHIHNALEKLIALYDLSESEARHQLPAYEPPALPSQRLIFYQRPKFAIPKSKKRGKLVLLDEHDEESMMAAGLAGKKPSEMIARRQWGFPQGYIEEVVGADPKDCFVLAMSRPDRFYNLTIGDRIIVDSGDQEPGDSGNYLVWTQSGLQLMPGSRFARDVEELRPFVLVVFGRISGRIGVL